jgi:hypothetical protein
VNPIKPQRCRRVNPNPNPELPVPIVFKIGMWFFHMPIEVAGLSCPFVAWRFARFYIWCPTFVLAKHWKLPRRQCNCTLSPTLFLLVAPSSPLELLPLKLLARDLRHGWDGEIHEAFWESPSRHSCGECSPLSSLTSPSSVADSRSRSEKYVSFVPFLPYCSVAVGDWVPAFEGGTVY